MKRQRVFAIAAIAALTLGYQWLNKTVQGGWQPHLFLDDWIPLAPIWVVPYLLTLPGLLIVAIISAHYMDNAHFWRFACAMAVTMLSCYACFWLLPTFVQRPKLMGDEWATNLLRRLYAQDKPNNACPSLHIALAACWCLAWVRWLPRGSGVWGFILIVIVFSTLFTKQHYVLDVLGGCGVGGVSGVSGVWSKWVAPFEYEKDSNE